MNPKQLLSYIDKLISLYMSATVCYQYRTMFRDKCVLPKNRDQPHEDAIQLSKQFAEICKDELLKVNQRYHSFKTPSKALQDSFRTFDALFNQTPHNSVDNLNE